MAVLETLSNNTATISVIPNEAILPPLLPTREHLAMSAEIFACQNCDGTLDCTGIEVRGIH